MRARGKAVCSKAHQGKGAFHDIASTTHDRGHAGEESLTAYPRLIRATSAKLESVIALERLEITIHLISISYVNCPSLSIYIDVHSIDVKLY